MINVQQQRLRDVKQALSDGGCISSLARQWGLSKPGTLQWLDRHAPPDERRKLAENGRTRAQQKMRGFDLAARMQMIAACQAAGMSYEKIGAAIGVSAVSIWTLVNRHAPHGLAEAMEDFREDQRVA
jgi:hypothetical protein